MRSGGDHIVGVPAGHDQRRAAVHGPVPHLASPIVGDVAGDQHRAGAHGAQLVSGRRAGSEESVEDVTTSFRVRVSVIRVLLY